MSTINYNRLNPINHLKPFGYYVLLRLLEHESDNDEWLNCNGILLKKESLNFQYSFWARLIDKGSLCVQEDVVPGDIVRLPRVYTRERYYTEDGVMYIITKESNMIAKLDDGTAEDLMSEIKGAYGKS